MCSCARRSFPIALGLFALLALSGWMLLADDAKPGGEKKDPKKVPTKEDTSNAASEILRKYMRRPK